jgi:hypothetical protein
VCFLAAAPSLAKCKPPGLPNTYLLNTTRATFDDAEATCNRYGGHLVGYSSLAEQRAVEQCFTNTGFLLPNFHKFYWMGLRTGFSGAQWPNFTWIDLESAIYMGDYQHWGVFQPGGVLEPNRAASSQEDCAGANLTMGIATHSRAVVQYDGAGGWADRSCFDSYIFICEVQRGWRNRLRRCTGVGACQPNRGGCSPASLWHLAISACRCTRSHLTPNLLPGVAFVQPLTSFRLSLRASRAASTRCTRGWPARPQQSWCATGREATWPASAP